MRFPKTPRLVFVFVVTGELLGLNVPARGERPPDSPIRTRTLIAEKDAKIAQLSDVLTKKVEQEQDLMKINGLLNANLAQAKAPLYQKYLQAQIAYYDHEMAMWIISELLYQWQQKASNVVMSLVCIDMLAEISISGLQL